jgi:RNA polymerase sigma factor (sigma-70 family)
MKMKEEELIKGCINKCPKCEKEFYYFYVPLIRKICSKYWKEYSDIEENCQLAFIRIFKKLHLFSFKGSFEGWLRLLTRNVCLVNKNSKNRLNNNLNHIILNGNILLSHNPEIYFKFIKQDIYKKLNILSERNKNVMYYVIDGYSYKEISKKLNISEESLRTIVNRSRKKLKKLHNDKNKRIN